MDELVAELRNHVPMIQAVADRAYAGAHAAMSLGLKAALNRTGDRATDLVAALIKLS